MNDEHFEDQAKQIKNLYYKYNARKIVIDGNGMGIGLIDYMVKKQVDPDSGEMIYPDFGIDNDEEGFYKKFKTDVTVHDAIYIIKANASINTEAHTNVASQLSSGKLRFLVDEKIAKSKLMETKVGQSMRPEERAKYLQPYTLTSILKEELLNLREETEGVNIILRQANKNIKKDKFSSLEYGLYYIKITEASKKRKRFNIKDFMFMN